MAFRIIGIKFSISELFIITLTHLICTPDFYIVSCTSHMSDVVLLDNILKKGSGLYGKDRRFVSRRI